jgi:hypothetical protein
MMKTMTMRVQVSGGYAMSLVVVNLLLEFRHVCCWSPRQAEQFAKHFAFRQQFDSVKPRPNVGLIYMGLEPSPSPLICVRASTRKRHAY